MTRARAAAALAGFLAALAPRPASPCGGFYGDEVQVDPDQKIVVVHRGGVETYVFQPRFCGAAKDFGVILPVPSTLSANPALANPALFEQLDRYTEPTIDEVCDSGGGIGCGSKPMGDGGIPPEFGTGVDVVDSGRVGDFEYSVLHATSVDAFTQWLGTNGYPYDAYDTQAYQGYVTEDWYFVAFKVSAAADAPPPGMRLCGDLGPIQLSFAAPSPVVPARIAGVNAVSYVLPTWRIFVIAAAQYRVDAATSFEQTLYFSGALTGAGLADYGEIAALSENGDRLTAIDVRFPNGSASSDVAFEQEPSPADFRSTRTFYKDCGGCQAGGAPAGFAGAVAVMLIVRSLRRRRASSLIR